MQLNCIDLVAFTLLVWLVNYTYFSIFRRLCQNIKKLIYANKGLIL